MRAPIPSEPITTFPTYQVPLESAMRGSASPVQVQARAAWEDRADLLGSSLYVYIDDSSVIIGSSCFSNNNSNIKMQSVTENCLLNSVTVPKIQRITDHDLVAHNNSSKLDIKFGALPPGRDIPNKKADDLELLFDDFNALKFISTSTSTKFTSICDNNDNKDYDMCHLHRFNFLPLIATHPDCYDSVEEFTAPLRLRGGGESSLSTGTSGWGSPPSQQTANTNGMYKEYFHKVFILCVFITISGKYHLVWNYIFPYLVI